MGSRLRAHAVTAVLLTLTAGADRAGAQDPAVLVAPRPTTPGYVKAATAVYLGAMVADWATTAAALHAGAVETNPVARVFVADRQVGGYVAGAALDAAAVLLVRRTIGRHHPRVATAVLIFGAGLRLSFVAANLRTVESLHAHPPR